MITVTKFSAKWCEPCNTMKPVIVKLRKAHPNWEIIELDIDQNEAVAEKENIRSVPTLIFREGKKKEKRITGYASKAEIEEFVRKNFGGVK